MIDLRNPWQQIKNCFEILHKEKKYSKKKLASFLRISGYRNIQIADILNQKANNLKFTSMTELEYENIRNEYIKTREEV